MKNITGIIPFFWSESGSKVYKDFKGNAESHVIEAGFKFANVNTISVRTFPILDANIYIKDEGYINDFFDLEEDFSSVDEELSNHISTVTRYYFTTCSYNSLEFKVR